MTTPQAWQDVLGFVTESTFTDVLVPGLIDRDGTRPTFLPLFNDLYLETEHRYLRLTSVGNQGGIHVQIADSISFDPDMAAEYPADYITMTMSAQFFGERDKVDCRAVTYFTNHESDLESCVVRALELHLVGDQAIFFDPWCTQGMQLGKAGSAELWLQSGPFDPDGTLEQHVWVPASA